MAAHRIARRRQAGFTLIEILIALMITTVGLVVISGLFVTGSKGTAYARHATEASVLAEDRLEALLVTPTAQLTSGSDQVDGQGLPVTDGGFTRTWTVDWATDVARIAVRVSWRDGAHDRALEFKTMRAR